MADKGQLHGVFLRVDAEIADRGVKLFQEVCQDMDKVLYYKSGMLYSSSCY